MVKRRSSEKVFYLFVVIIASLSLTSIVYSHWYEELYLNGQVTSGYWSQDIRIRKSLYGAFTDPVTGEVVEVPTQLIGVATDFPTRFLLIITVENLGGEMHNVGVTDVIKNTVIPVKEICEADAGTLEWVDIIKKNSDFQFNYLTWTIGTIKTGETLEARIWIETLPNPSGKYEPTSGDEGDGQYIEINSGATLWIETGEGTFSATTDDIIIQISDNGVEGDDIGVISPDLPIITDWVYPS